MPLPSADMRAGTVAHYLIIYQPAGAALPLLCRRCARAVDEPRLYRGCAYRRRANYRCCVANLPDVLLRPSSRSDRMGFCRSNACCRVFMVLQVTFIPAVCTGRTCCQFCLQLTVPRTREIVGCAILLNTAGQFCRAAPFTHTLQHLPLVYGMPHCCCRFVLHTHCRC